ncbi:MAG: DUF1906 domain-containing protein [Gemmatimonadetes bacterium]|nr:DUF1906 domain-containing protein [Gemmatimonadota bacterium]
MPLAGSVLKAPAGAKGFDANTPISASVAKQFIAAGHRFCVRYVGRTKMGSQDLTAAEAQELLGAGLALMAVQHVEAGEWAAGGDLGAEYGRNAASFAQAIGFPAGINVWLDLESVSTSSAPADVIAYCNNWHDAVAAAGFAPGVYVGWQPMLTNADLLNDLKFNHYWGAYNVDAVIPKRGWQMKQSPASQHIAGIDHDDNLTHVDGLGGQVLWLAPSGDASWGSPAV